MDTFEAQVYVLKKSEGGRSHPITNKYIQLLFASVWSMDGCVLLDDSIPMIMPGETQNVRIWLRQPMVLRQGQRFTMRENKLTTLTGKLTKILPSHDEKLSGFNYRPPDRRGSLTIAQQKGKSKKMQ